jgi:ABC-2 type transport system permease protein
VNALALTASQIRYVNKAFWRNPSRAFFTFAFPLMFLVIFTSLLGNYKTHVGDMPMKSSTYYVASMACFGVITACYNNISIAMTAEREAGILKRVDGSPLPKGAFMASRVVHAVLVAAVLMACTAAFGAAFYGAHVLGGFALARFVLVLLVGAATFCALGLAVTAIIRNADAAPAIVNATILPLLFLSGVFIPFGNDTPSWILWVARVFPVKHFASGMMAGFVGTPFAWTDLLIVAAWGIAAVAVSVRYFRWLPSAG